MTIQLGVCLASQITDVDYAVLAEELGFDDLWFADSQMIWSDVYAVMALAAARTSRIRIGTGVAVAGTRSVAVTAAAHATISAIAPGRVFCGIGTGNTAMRVMGHRPMPIAEFESYIESLLPLLGGRETTVTWRGRTAAVRHLMPEHGFVNFADRIPLYISGFGPLGFTTPTSNGGRPDRPTRRVGSASGMSTSPCLPTSTRRGSTSACTRDTTVGSFRKRNASSQRN